MGDWPSLSGSGRHARALYELRLDGPFVESRRVEIEVSEELDLEVATRPAGMRRVVLEVPASAERPRWMWLEVTDAAGAWLWTGGGPPARDGDAWALELEVSARPGAHRFHAGTSTSLSQSGELEIAGCDGDPVPRVVRFSAE